MLDLNKNILIEMKVGEQRTNRMGWPCALVILGASTEAWRCGQQQKENF